jgi:hypothetical protein
VTTKTGLPCQRVIVSLPCYIHEPMPSSKTSSSSLKLKPDHLRPHVSCGCSAEVVSESPHATKVIYCESTCPTLLPEILQNFLREDIALHTQIVVDGQQFTMEDIFAKIDKEVREMRITYEVEEEEEDEDPESNECLEGMEDDEMTEGMEENGREVAWNGIMKEKHKMRLERMMERKNPIITAKKVQKILSALSVSVPKRLKGKKGMIQCLLTFYKKELLWRTSSSFKVSCVKRWNLNTLVQVLKIRYRKYSSAVTKLYAQLSK